MLHESDKYMMYVCSWRFILSSISSPCFTGTRYLSPAEIAAEAQARETAADEASDTTSSSSDNDSRDSSGESKSGKGGKSSKGFKGGQGGTGGKKGGKGTDDAEEEREMARIQRAMLVQQMERRREEQRRGGPGFKTKADKELTLLLKRQSADSTQIRFMLPDGTSTHT